MADADPFGGIDPDALDDLAGRVIAAFTAVLQFGRQDQDDLALFDAAVLKALLYAQAALIVHPANGVGRDDLLLASYAVELGKTVATFREIG